MIRDRVAMLINDAPATLLNESLADQILSIPEIAHGLEIYELCKDAIDAVKRENIEFVEAFKREINGKSALSEVVDYMMKH